MLSSSYLRTFSSCTRNRKTAAKIAPKASATLKQLTLKDTFERGTKRKSEDQVPPSTKNCKLPRTCSSKREGGSEDAQMLRQHPHSSIAQVQFVPHGGNAQYPLYFGTGAPVPHQPYGALQNQNHPHQQQTFLQCPSGVSGDPSLHQPGGHFGGNCFGLPNFGPSLCHTVQPSSTAFMAQRPVFHVQTLQSSNGNQTSGLVPHHQKPERKVPRPLATASWKTSGVKPMDQAASTTLTQQYSLSSPSFRDVPRTPTPITRRPGPTPIPKLDWANADDVWHLMCIKDKVYQRDSNYLQKHPSLRSKMREILLCWLTEVCEVYRLHRETFYLATDFIDRFLSLSGNVDKFKIQLVGITALFVAAKLEEIYPPKLREFAYVTDGACTENQILAQELILLTMLKWSLSPVTAHSWLSCFMQSAARLPLSSSSENSSAGTKRNLLNFGSTALSSTRIPLTPEENRSPQELWSLEHRVPQTPLNAIPFSPTLKMDMDVINSSPGAVKKKKSFEFPAVHTHAFLQLAQLLDLCTMDIESLRFAPSLLAASVVYHMIEPEDTACRVSGYTMAELNECITWMCPHALAISEQPTVHQKPHKDIPRDNIHNIQTHSVEPSLLDRVRELKSEIAQRDRRSPVFCNNNSRSLSDMFPTPPNSSERSDSAYFQSKTPKMETCPMAMH